MERAPGENHGAPFEDEEDGVPSEDEEDGVPSEDGEDGVPFAYAAEVERAVGARVVSAQPLAAGLGLRRFVRLQLDRAPHRLIARLEADEDPAGRPRGAAPEPPLEPLRRHLERAGLPVPRAWPVPVPRLDLLEDLGTRSLDDAVRDATAERRRALYAAVVALVPRLQRVAPPAEGLPAFERRLDAQAIAYKGELFGTWSLPEALGRAPRAAERDAVAEGFAAIAEALADAPLRLAHRDLQSRNVMVPDPDARPPRVVLIDLQGAWLAPPEYDLVCLLRDSYVEIPPEEVEAHLAAVRPELPDAPAPDVLARRFALLTLARKGKDHARFLYAAARRDDRRFLAHVPTTVRGLHAAAAALADAEPRLRRLAELVAALPEAAPCAG